ncbi:hypothetical protein K1719_001162 [Acacia pycnantha]|nr:hypothetical protein K1719_001162 [Acacia pycnantha]
MALFSLKAYGSSVICMASFKNHSNGTCVLDSSYIRRAAEIADKSAGFIAPHPNFGCVLATASGNIVGEGFPLCPRAASQLPFSVLKFTMTLDGKIATSSGHAALISSKQSRNLVFELHDKQQASAIFAITELNNSAVLTFNNS